MRSAMLLTVRHMLTLRVQSAAGRADVGVRVGTDRACLASVTQVKPSGSALFQQPVRMAWRLLLRKLQTEIACPQLGWPGPWLHVGAGRAHVSP